MRALTVVPTQPGSLEVRDLADPVAGAGELLVDGIALGICGTDHEIVHGVYGSAPLARTASCWGTSRWDVCGKPRRTAVSSPETWWSAWSAARTRSPAGRAPTA